jgi:uncharacterized membrane protein
MQSGGGGRATRRRASTEAPATDAGHNVGQMERVASVVGGAALVTAGARRRDLGGAMLAIVGGMLLHRGATGRCMVYDAMGVNTAGQDDANWLVQKHGPAAVLDASQAIKVEHSVTIAAAPEELYRYWRNFENLPRIMRHLERVTVLDDARSRWTAKAPAGQTVEWDAIINNEIENQLIAWKSVDDATVPNAGSVHFKLAPGGETEVKVVIEYQPPAGRLGALVARLFGEEPGVQIRDDLQRFKATVEEEKS